MIEYDTLLAPHDGTCRFCADPIKEGQRVKYWDWSSWYHAACVDAHRTRQAKVATDALAVLRDLVASANDHRCWYIPDEIAGRIRALVAEHPTNEETT